MTDHDTRTSATVTTLGSLQSSRRQMLAMAAVGGASAAFLASSPPADAAQEKGVAPARGRYRLTVLGTTDTHGNVYNWDYFKNAEYSDKDSNDIGLAKIATLVHAMRDERGADNTLLLDAGDIIQGTPLAYYYAKVDPITGGSTHPMAAAMNLLRYDAAALGNHEFNYGLDTLRTFDEQCAFPLLCANALDWSTGAPVFTPYVIKTVKVPGDKPLTVGILGLVTPGVAIWDKANVEGRVRFGGIVEQARVMVPRLKRAGCDLVVVSCHSGPVPSSSYGDALPFPENASTQLAEQVPDIDAILVGHAHLEVPERFVTNATTGKQVLLSEPLKWGMRLTVMDLDVEKVKGQWRLAQAAATLLNANTVPEDSEVAAELAAAQDIVLTYVNSPIGTCTAEMSAETSRFEDTPAMDFVNHVQGDAVRQAVAGSAEANLPVLSIVAPFNREASIPAGNVTVRDVAGMYIYDNTLLGIVLTGAQVRDYLEFSARYFQQVTGSGPFLASQVTNAVTPTAPTGTPDYNYDIVAGLDAPLRYDIDISRPAGQRITNLSYDGKPLDPAQGFLVAINNYRQSGGGGFPGVTTAPVAYNAQVEIRQLLIDWVTAHQTIDPPSFTSYDWRLVSGTSVLDIENDDPDAGHH